jgi:penicillin-binding protein 1C
MGRWVYRKKIYFIGFFTLNFFIWLFCLPSELFEDPTCTVIVDRDGNILNARIADDGQWRFPPRTDVPYKFKQAIIQFEDRDFMSHWGFSFKAFGRAMKQNISAGKVVSGGSTITMQIIRISRKGQGRTVWEKIIEIYQGTRMEWSFSKDEILAMYASNAPMGGNVVGLDAAAWRYFGRKAEDLSWAESCLLAVLPNAPGLLHLSKNREKLTAKRNRLLDRLLEVNIITSEEYRLALIEELPTAPPDLPNLAPHLTDKAIKDGKKGNWVITYLSKNLQEEINKIIGYHHSRLKENEIHNAAAIVINVETGKVVAYIGNAADKENIHGNHVDVITAPRSTGSILKPFLYASMIEDGTIMPKQLVEDVPMILSGYAPKNYNQKYDGVVPASRALSRSLNVPIVKMLKNFGVQKFHTQLQKIGISTINRPASEYGLSLVLGGAEATLWDLCRVYSNMAQTLNHYKKGMSHSFQNPDIYANIANGDDYKNFHLFNPAAIWSTFEAMLEVVRPNEENNWQQFQSSSKIAWKTGTSYGFRDAWAIGITPKYVVGVWVGNGSGEGRPGLIGIEAAAPILFDIFSRLPSSEWFKQPFDEMVKIPVCHHSGHKASPICTHVDTLYIPESCSKTMICPYHKMIHTDMTGQYRVNSSCEMITNMQQQPWFVLPPIAEKFYRNKNPNYKPLPPFRNDCVDDNKFLPLDIIYPKHESNIYVPIQLGGMLSKTIFEASHTHANMRVFWHLDEQYIGETVGIHQLEIVPSEGEHILLLIDENGAQVTRKFNVLSEKK